MIKLKISHSAVVFFNKKKFIFEDLYDHLHRPIIHVLTKGPNLPRVKHPNIDDVLIRITTSLSSLHRICSSTSTNMRFTFPTQTLATF